MRAELWIDLAPHNDLNIFQRPLESMSRTSYSFVSTKEDRSDLILEEAVGFSKLEHAPYTENGNTVKLLTE